MQKYSRNSIEIDLIFNFVHHSQWFGQGNVFVDFALKAIKSWSE